MASVPEPKRRRSDRIAACCILAYRATGACAIVAMAFYAVVTAILK